MKTLDKSKQANERTKLDKQLPKYDKNNLTAYQKFLLSQSNKQDKNKYFSFYNDVKHSTHQIYDW